MKRTLFALALLFGVFANAVAENWDVVTSSGDYYYGEGVGETYEAARNMAMKALTGMIATHVSNDFTYLIYETNKNGEIKHESRVLNCLNTYSQATLNNVEEWKKHIPPQWIVRCYILRSDMEKVYASRIEKAKMYCITAEQALKERNLVDALHDYYWAYSLIRSLQKPNDAKDDDGNLLVVTIPKKIEHILNNVEVTFESRNESDRGDRVNLLFTYEGKPVSSLEFSYNNGQDISSGCSVKNGRGAFDVQKMHSGEVYHLNLEFEHKQLAQRDVELAGVLNVVPKAVFRGAEKKAAIADLGADLIVDTNSQDLAEVLTQELEAGRGVDIAIDCVGGESMGKYLHCLNKGARWIMIAALAGTQTTIDLRNVYVRHVRIIGSTLRSRDPEVKAQILAELVEKLWPKVATGEVKPTIFKVLPITQAELAHDQLYKSQSTGKIVMTVE